MIDALPLLLGPEGYQISRSVRLRQSAGGYLNRTLSASGSTSQWTYSKWTKRGLLGSFNVLLSSCITGSTYYQSVLAFDSSDRLWYYQFSNGSGYSVNVTSTAVFRDPSAWYHVVMKFDATTSSMIVWVNNQQVINSSSFSTTNRLINSNNVHYIGNYAYQTVDPGRYDGYFTEINFIDGQVLTPNSFGETNPVTGVWQPKKYAGTYGTNGFYLNFSDNSAATAAAIGADSSGNGNNWTPNNISVTAGVTYDSMLDVPTQWADGGNGRGNYATLNPLSLVGNTFSEANLKITSATNTKSAGTIALPATGKWYWECVWVTNGGASSPQFGLVSQVATATSANDNLWYRSDGTKFDQTNTSSAYGATWTTNDVIGVAVDMDAGTLTFYKNNTSQGTAFSTITTRLSGNIFPSVKGNVAGDVHVINFGQRPFAYTPPSGFKALNTLNLPEPTILKGNQYFDVKTRSGTGAVAVITGYQFAPDLVWIKARNNIRDHGLMDTVRGVQKYLGSNLTNAEGTTTNGLTSFNADGYTLGSSASDSLSVNLASDTFVDWAWKEGATQGFDIVTYTGDGVDGRTVAHNLGVVPSMVIVKSRSTGTDWNVKHASLSSNNVLQLNATNAQNTPGSGYIGDLNSSTTFTLKNGGAAITNVNGNGTTYVAYLFAEVAGFSKFGKYTGNGSTDGPFIFTGFRPRFVMVKRIDLTNDWFTVDSSRNTYNIASALLRPNTSAAEQTSGVIDVLSNGFKPRTTDSAYNASGGTYIFAAFAENPAKYSLAR